MTVVSFLYVLSQDWGFSLGWQALWILALLSILAGAQFFNTRVRAEVLKYLSSSEYFVSARILMTAVLTGFGILVFREAISTAQFVWLVIGSCGIILLFEEDTRLQHSRNWARAVYLLILSVILGAIIQISAKYISLASDQIGLILFYEGLMLIVFLGIFYKNKMPFVVKNLFGWRELAIAMLFGVSIYGAAVFNFLAFASHGPVGIVSKIIWYSLFIPIILSMIFYHEKLTLRKWIALILTIVSIYYLG